MDLRILIVCGFILSLNLSCKTRESASQTRNSSAVDSYGTKTPYMPQQDWRQLEPVPADFHLVFVQIVSRHGARGLTRAKSDLIIYNMLQRADSEAALTPLGKQLLLDVKDLLFINSLLGMNVPGIRQPGYGNLSLRGLAEQRALGQRLFLRQEAFFMQLVTDPADGNPFRIEYQSSGENRARDSATAFIDGLSQASPGLRVLTKPSSAVPEVVNAQAGIDRFMLYFHGLKTDFDRLNTPNHPYSAILGDSLRYQAFVNSADLKTKLQSLRDSDTAAAFAKGVLSRLVNDSFLGKISQGGLAFTNSTAQPITGRDGKTSISIAGTGDTTASSAVELASHLYELSSIAPALSVELGNRNIDQYIPEDAAAFFSYIEDATDFYEVGPSTTESSDSTTKAALGLWHSFFEETDALLKGGRRVAAVLRFGHAETMIPLAAAIGFSFVGPPVPSDLSFSYDEHQWRGANVSPFSANLQWEVYQRQPGEFIVKVLYNEADVELNARCASAKIAPQSFYYDYAQLRRCYYTN